MPEPTLPSIEPATLNDFVLTMERNRTNDFQDIVNVNRPAHKALMRKGAIKDDAPGIGPTRDFQYQQSRRETFMSPTQTTAARDFAETEFMTEAQFRYVAWNVTMTLPKYKFDMTKGNLARYNYVKRQMDNKDKNLVETYNDVLWNGRVIGSTPCWGLKDLARFDVTTNPTKGAIGGIDVTNPLFTRWKNHVANYNNPFLTLSNGGRLSSFLDTGTNSLSSVFRRASDNLEGNAPDVMFCNEVLMLDCEQLWRDNMLSARSSGANELGVDSFVFKGMDMVWDSMVPNDPTNSEWGVGMGFNCEYGVEVVYADGLRREVTDMQVHPTHHGYFWDTYVYMCLATCNPGLNFVIHGVKPATSV